MLIAINGIVVQVNRNGNKITHGLGPPTGVARGWGRSCNGRSGFHTSQLIEYTLEPNPHAEDDKNGPPQKLTLAFSTADVAILGWRLGRLADLLRENNLATVHVLPKRYADLDRGKPFVASITITPIGKD